MNRIEKYIYNFYKRISISEPHHLGVHSISERINLPVLYWEFTSEATHYDGRYKMFINQHLPPQQQWQDFGHEICHILRHDGDQNGMVMSFLELQEWQANYFSYHFCVPTFMLVTLEEVTVYEIMTQFNVDFEFASKRLNLLNNKIIGVLNDVKIQRLSMQRVSSN